MSKFRLMPCVALLGLALGGCSDSSGVNLTEPEAPASPQPEMAVDFTTFVKAEIGNTSDEREPVNINNREFSFNDQNNEQAFDALF